MSSACSNTGILPNPDISGIGVRAAIYAQAVLTLVQPIIASIDRRITEKELEDLHSLYIGILLPGCALLLSAIIQATTLGLSVYHAILVLQLSWINNTSALIFFQFALIAQIRLENERKFRRRVGVSFKLLYQLMEKTEKTIPKDENGTRSLLRERAFTLKNALAKQEVFPHSKDTLEEVVQNLSALRAAVTDDSEPSLMAVTDASEQPRAAGAESEVAKAVKMTDNRTRLLKSLGVEVGDSGPSPWWKVIGRGLQTMINRTISRLPKGEQVVKLLNRDWIMATLASAHLTLFAAFGVWVWFTLYNFGDCDRFTRDTRLAILPRVNIRVVSPLRIWFIVLYIICLVPILNIVIIGGLEFLTVEIVRYTFFSRREFYLASFIVLTFLVQVYFIVTTELTIQTNRGLLADSAQEGDWTFGQTLAVALVTMPLKDVVTESWDQRETVGKELKGLWSEVQGLWSRVIRRLPFPRRDPNKEDHQMTA